MVLYVLTTLINRVDPKLLILEKIGREGIEDAVKANSLEKLALYAMQNKFEITPKNLTTSSSNIDKQEYRQEPAIQSQLAEFYGWYIFKKSKAEKKKVSKKK